MRKVTDISCYGDRVRLWVLELSLRGNFKVISPDDWIAPYDFLDIIDSVL
jgi:hypothetical protein